MDLAPVASFQRFCFGRRSWPLKEKSLESSWSEKDRCHRNREHCSPGFRGAAKFTAGLSKRQPLPEDIRHHSVVIVHEPLADGQGPINNGSGPGSAVVSYGERTHGDLQTDLRRRHWVGQCLVRAIGKNRGLRRLLHYKRSGVSLVFHCSPDRYQRAERR